MPGAAWRYCADECECIWDRRRCEDDDKCAVGNGFTGCSDPNIMCGMPGSAVSLCCPVTCGLCTSSSFHLDLDSSFGFKGLRGGCSAASGEGDVFGGLRWYVSVPCKAVYMVRPPGGLMPEHAVGRCYVRGGVLCDQAMPSNITKHAAFKQCQLDDEACRCTSDGMSGDVTAGVAGCADHGESNLTSPGRTY